jgi:hypothetical protein
MHRAYFLYCRIATAVFMTNTIFPIGLKLYQDRLAHDWMHSFLHLVTALVAAYAAWGTTRVLPAKLFTWGIGATYLTLGIYGWFVPGMFLHSHFAIPLGVVDNVFHLALSLTALTLAVRDFNAWVSSRKITARPTKPAPVPMIMGKKSRIA